ncbi:MAG: putative efflux rane fusion protein [Myxococcaceae bacterium]|nr:putative efflux rane fusion protein [Myxococcaceae bacterium]
MKPLALALCVWMVAGCAKEGGGGPGPGGKPGSVGARKALVFPVQTEPVQVREVEYTLNAVGSVEAFERVQITARVAGAVDSVRFVEGQRVKANELLVEIDSRRYTLMVRAAKAALDRVAATKAEADAALARREQVQKTSPGLITFEELATFTSRVATAAADLASAQVTLEQAELNLRDAYVRAPVAGVLQTRTVSTGQYVPVGTALASMVRRDPLLVRFKVPEPDAQRLLPGMPVRFLSSGDSKPMTAKIASVAEVAEEATRMVTVTAEVEAADRERARPGAFAEVTVPVGQTREAPVVPQTAVRPSERGFLAFVIQGTTAKERILELGMRTTDGRVEVKDGLKPGEQLVIRGAEALRDGAQVVIAGPTPVAREPGAGVGGAQ